MSSHDYLEAANVSQVGLTAPQLAAMLAEFEQRLPMLLLDALLPQLEIVVKNHAKRIERTSRAKFATSGKLAEICCISRSSVKRKLTEMADAGFPIPTEDVGKVTRYDIRAWNEAYEALYKSQVQESV